MFPHGSTPIPEAVIPLFTPKSSASVFLGSTVNNPHPTTTLIHIIALRKKKGHGRHPLWANLIFSCSGSRWCPSRRRGWRNNHVALLPTALYGVVCSARRSRSDSCRVRIIATTGPIDPEGWPSPGAEWQGLGLVLSVGDPLWRSADL